MKKLVFAAACAVVLGGCAELPQQPQGAEKRFTEEDDYVTGSRIPRKAPKNETPAQAGGGGIGGVSTSR